MTRRPPSPSVAALLACLVLAWDGAGALAGEDRGLLTGRVLVLGGDTIVVGRQRVKLWGIDAADLNQECMPHKTLTCGEYARIALQQLATGRVARCEVKEKPSFAVHVVARCEITVEGRTIDLSREMVRLGHAYAEPGEGGGVYESVEQRVMSFKRPSLWRELQAEKDARRR